MNETLRKIFFIKDYSKTSDKLNSNENQSTTIGKEKERSHKQEREKSIPGSNFDIRKIMVRDYRAISHRINFLLCAIIIALTLLSCYLIYDTQQLREQMDKRIYVQVGNEIYSAIRSEQINANIVRGFCDMSFGYLFNHDEYNYSQRTDIAKSFFKRKSYNYIVSRFNTRTEATEGLTLLEMYQTYDARMSLNITDVQFNPSNMTVLLEGEMRYVFEGKEPKKRQARFAFVIERVSKSEDNPYGLRVSGLKPVQ